MIVLNSPKGWTGPKVVDGLQVEGTFRSHQVPLSDPATYPEQPQAARRLVEELPAGGTLRRAGPAETELAELAPKGERRMGANPHANGGMLLPRPADAGFRDYAEDVPSPGTRGIGDTHVLGASCGTWRS